MTSLEDQAHRQHNTDGDNERQRKGRQRLVSLGQDICQEAPEQLQRDREYNDGQHERDNNVRDH